jgi:hypothetical protein
MDIAVQKLEGPKQVGLAILGAGVVAGLFRVMIDAASRLHLAASAVLAVLLLAGALWLTRQVKYVSRDADLAGVVGSLALGLLTVGIIGAWISYSLHVGGVALYTVPEQFSIGTFMDGYMYAFLDLIPALRIPETVHLRSPIESTTPLGGLPVLGFKVFVVWLFFDAVKSWLKRRRSTPVSVATS